MLCREQMALELLLPRPVRAVVIGPALLVLDDLALVVQVLLAERIQEGRHPVRLQPERELQLVGRQGLVVIRAVEPRGPIHGPAGGLHERDVLGLGYVARALEHDVLKEVGEPGLAGDLVLGADVVPEVDCDDWGEVILGHDDAETVGKALVAERDLRDGRGHARPQGWGGASDAARRDRSVGTIVTRQSESERAASAPQDMVGTDGTGRKGQAAPRPGAWRFVDSGT